MGIHERKEREKEHRREAIINAAQKVFFEKGLQVATMDEIAEAAELSKGTLYLYYKSKEDLYLTVMMRGMRILHDMFAKTLSSNEPTIQLLARLGETYYEFFKEHRDYFRMFNFFENPRFHKQVSSEMREACTWENQRIWKLVVDLIQRGITEGVLKADLNPAETGVILWANANALMLQIDAQRDEYWKETMNIDIEHAFQTANRLLLEAIMTEEAKQIYRSK
jgi:AcrR family transcriptional regulator